MIDASLLRAVIADPDDDAVRLVAADWCEDHGDPERAEFIRAQVEAARVGRYHPRRLGLERRAKALADSHAKRWVEEDGLSALDYPEFRRGFVEHAVMQRGGSGRGCEAFLEKAPAAFERTPLRSIELRDRGPTEEFLNSPLVERLTELHFRQYPDVPAAVDRVEAGRSWESLGWNPLCEMLGRPRLRGLRRFRLDADPTEGPYLGAVANLPRFDRLEAFELRLRADEFDLPALPEVVHAKWLTGIQRLAIRAGDADCAYRPMGLEAVCQTRRRLLRLTHLDVGRQEFGPDTFGVLARWPGLARLERLDIDSSAGEEPVAAAEVRSFAHSPRWRDLRELDVSGTVEQPDAAKALLSSPRLQSLRVLHIRPNDDDDPDAADAVALMLVGCPHLDGLVELELGWYEPGEQAERLLRERFGGRLSGVARRFGEGQPWTN